MVGSGLRWLRCLAFACTVEFAGKYLHRKGILRGRASARTRAGPTVAAGGRALCVAAPTRSTSTTTTPTPPHCSVAADRICFN